jgi:hypothetical protein
MWGTALSSLKGTQLEIAVLLSALFKPHRQKLART